MTSKLKMHSPDLTEDNIAKIATLFPNCISESRDEQGRLKQVVDFDWLRQELSDVIVEGEQERYRLDWVGKKEAILAANAPIAKTLRPCREESVNFDTTENLFIEGDNLDALKLLQENYLGKVKMIYIDPPYNTGKDFIYNDDFAESSKEFFTRSQQFDEEGNRLIANTESNGRFHSDWLSMMYSRLKLARNLLADDGVIFISIDNNEQAQLKMLCDSIFGSANFIDNLIIMRSANGMGSKEGYSTNHDFVLVYKRNFTVSNSFKGIQPSEEYKTKFNKEDKYGKYKIDGIFRKKGQGARREESPGCFYPIYVNLKNGEVSLDFSETLVEITPKLPNGEDGRWIWSKEFAKTRLFRLYASEGGTVYVKDYWDSNIRQKPKSILDKSSYLTDSATNELIKLFNCKVFSTPKPIGLLFDLIDNCLSDNDIILDFFAGSATTAHAVMQLNAEDGGNRRFIMVQLPEATDEKSEAFKAGYPTIAEISKERIRRAAAKIRDDFADKLPEDWDGGFRVLKVDSTNMKKVYYRPDEVAQSDLLDMVSHIKEDRSGEDLLFQVMLDWGLPLSLPIQERDVDGKKVYFIGEKSSLGYALAACFDELNEAVIQAVAAETPQKFVSVEYAISQDADKTNIKEWFKQLSPETDVKFI